MKLDVQKIWTFFEIEQIQKCKKLTVCILTAFWLSKNDEGFDLRWNYLTCKNHIPIAIYEQKISASDSPEVAR